MMINKRLIGTVAESKKYIAGNVVLQWCSLAANIAMNGMAARDKIFRLLDLPEHEQEFSESFPSRHGIDCSGLRFSYEADREILHNVDLQSSPKAVLPRWSAKAAAGNPPSPPSS